MNCKSCGAPRIGKVCEYCGTEYLIVDVYPMVVLKMTNDYVMYRGNLHYV